ncbi:hypothetical protein B7494_g7704 [Chlorociboria aeruginascens]|nr:hypothetical protein B7494_g7704 [Chlorociboria aeruginascens]
MHALEMRMANLAVVPNISTRARSHINPSRMGQQRIEPRAVNPSRRVRRLSVNQSTEDVQQPRQSSRRPDLRDEFRAPAQERPHWKYKIIRTLGDGSSAIVSVAEMIDSSRSIVAVKQFRPSMETYFSKEIRNHASLQHKNIVYCYGWQYAPIHAIFFHKCETDLSYSMDSMLADGTYATRQPAVIWKVTHDILSALEYLEQKGIAHLDIKPENVMVSKKGDFLLGDFGLSEFVAEQTCTFAGTGEYIAPEVYAGLPNTTKSDIYSLCVLILWMWDTDVVQDFEQQGPAHDCEYIIRNCTNICNVIGGERGLKNIAIGRNHNEWHDRMARLYGLLASAPFARPRLFNHIHNRLNHIHSNFSNFNHIYNKLNYINNKLNHIYSNLNNFNHNTSHHTNTNHLNLNDDHTNNHHNEHNNAARDPPPQILPPVSQIWHCMSNMPKNRDCLRGGNDIGF